SPRTSRAAWGGRGGGRRRAKASSSTSTSPPAITWSASATCRCTSMRRSRWRWGRSRRSPRISSAPPVFNATWILVAALYALAVWLARRGRVDLPWRVAALFYALVLIFLFRPMTQATVSVPVDFIRTLPPSDNGAPPRQLPTSTMTELLMQIVPWVAQVRDAWRSLRFPLWNHLSGAG